MSAQTHTRTKSCEPLLFVPFFSQSKNFQNIANFMQSPIFRSSKPRPNRGHDEASDEGHRARRVCPLAEIPQPKRELVQNNFSKTHTRKKGSNILTPSRPNDQFRRTGGSSAEPRWCDAKSNQLDSAEEQGVSFWQPGGGIVASRFRARWGDVFVLKCCHMAGLSSEVFRYLYQN